MYRPRLGVVGTGEMTVAIAARLVQTGFLVSLHRVDADALDGSPVAGAQLAALPADAAESADVVILYGTNEKTTREALFDYGGVGESLRVGGYVLDLSTGSPESGRDATARLARFSITRLEVALHGEVDSAGRGRLRLVVAAKRRDITPVLAVLLALGDQVRYTEPVDEAVDAAEDPARVTTFVGGDTSRYEMAHGARVRGRASDLVRTDIPVG